METMPDYEHFSRNELLRIALDKRRLTEEARLAWDTELSRRGISNGDIGTFESEQASAEAADQKVVREVEFLYGIGKKLSGRKNYSHDPRFRIEEFDSTLWFILFWMPIFPLATYRIRRRFRRWWNVCTSDSYRVIARLPRNWEQILVTWIKAMVVLLVLRFAIPFVVNKLVYR